VDDAAREAVERFVRVTLGCRCPDEVFQSITLQRESGGPETLPLARLVVGDRLLIYVTWAHSATVTPDDFAALAMRGRADRNDRRLNRFRLVVAADLEAKSCEVAQTGFARAAAGDDRMHLHLLPPEAIPEPLRPSIAGRSTGARR
jgi:hypothetical protein